MNDDLCTWSHCWEPLPGPATASIAPEPKTHAVSSMMIGPSKRSSGAGGPLRRYGTFPLS